MRLSEFIRATSDRIISEWEVFARSCVPAANAMGLDQRRDHVAAMLNVIAADLDTPQTKRDQKQKAIGNDDSHVDSDTAANAHGTDRAATGYTPAQMVGEFRALRANVLRLWSEAQSEFNRANLDEITRFNEAIDQLLAESIARYAQDVDRVKDLFLGVVGHDLRNPLGAIMMSATVMLAKEGPDWAHAKTTARILSSGSRLELLIGDLLDFTSSRLGVGIPIVRSDIDLGATCRQTIDEIEAYHPGCVVKLAASGDLRGQWDGARISQALSNLLGNAYEHGAQNTPIEVTLHGEPDHVVLEVRNNGPMIAKSDLFAIFDPFRQLDPSRAKTNRGSVGLGLYIVHSIAIAHAGTIEVESTEHGTTFTLRLPRSPITSAERPWGTCSASPGSSSRTATST